MYIIKINDRSLTAVRSVASTVRPFAVNEFSRCNICKENSCNCKVLKLNMGLEIYTMV